MGMLGYKRNWRRKSENQIIFGNFNVCTNHCLCSGNANAETFKVMWGNAELKKGQIGRVTMLETGFSIFKLENGKMVPARYVKKGEVFRVYGTRKEIAASYYSLGANLFAYYESHRLDGSHSYLQKNLKYETPSESKLAIVNGNTKKEISLIKNSAK